MLVLMLVCINAVREDWFDSGKRNFFYAATWEVDFNARFSPRMYWVRAFEWHCQWWVDAPPLDEDLRCVREVIWNMDIRLAMSGSWFRLKSFDFDSQVGKSALALMIEVVVVVWQ